VNGAELAKEVNGHILEAAASSNPETSPLPVDLLCECGCMTSVKRTLNEYERDGGAWLVSHQPATTLSAHKKRIDATR
jgi:hypothetical protein